MMRKIDTKLHLAYMKPFSLVLFSRCSLTNGASFWKKGCLSGLAIVPAPLILAYLSQSLVALSATANRRMCVVSYETWSPRLGLLTCLAVLQDFYGLSTLLLDKQLLTKEAVRLQQHTISEDESRILLKQPPPKWGGHAGHSRKIHKRMP